MDSIEALHTALRRYCEAGHAEWLGRYMDLGKRERRERARLGLPLHDAQYSDDAYATFPHYRFLEAILIAIEAFTPADFSSLDEARALLAAAGETAENLLTQNPGNQIVQDVIEEERSKFVRYVNELTEEDLARVQPMPFRRTLSDEEVKTLRARLKERWSIDGYWYPIDRPDDAEPPPAAVAFNADPILEDQLPTLRSLLAEQSGGRVFEIREADPNRELDLELFEPTYNGLEGFWTNRDADWVIYASHEDSVTIAGSRILNALQDRWPAWSSSLYTPPY